MSQVSYHVDNIPNIPQGFDTFLSPKRIMRKLVIDGLGNVYEDGAKYQHAQLSGGKNLK